jgi:hypothetical protein
MDVYVRHCGRCSTEYCDWAAIGSQEWCLDATDCEVADTAAHHANSKWVN